MGDFISYNYAIYTKYIEFLCVLFIIRKMRSGFMEGIKILILEDDISLAEELKDFLTKWGYSTILIQDFSKVFNEYIGYNPDLVLMDINLPFYDGFYWCSKDKRMFSSTYNLHQ